MDGLAKRPGSLSCFFVSFAVKSPASQEASSFIPCLLHTALKTVRPAQPDCESHLEL